MDSGEITKNKFFSISTTNDIYEMGDFHLYEDSYDLYKNEFTEEYLDFLDSNYENENESKELSAKESSGKIIVTSLLGVIISLTCLCLAINCKTMKGGFRFLLSCKAVSLMISSFNIIFHHLLRVSTLTTRQRNRTFRTSDP